MTRSTQAVISLLLLIQPLITHAARAISGGSPVKEIKNVCPGEGGCVFRTWTAKAPIVVYRDRSHRTIAFRLKPGDEVTGLESILAVTRVGHCVARAETTLTAIPGGNDLKIKQGDSFDVFFSLGEDCMKGALNGVDVQACGSDKFVCDPEPRATLWLKVKNQAGVLGWTKDRDRFEGIVAH